MYIQSETRKRKMICSARSMFAVHSKDPRAPVRLGGASLYIAQKALLASRFCTNLPQRKHAALASVHGLLRLHKSFLANSARRQALRFVRDALLHAENPFQHLHLKTMRYLAIIA